MEGQQLPWVTLADRGWPNLERDFPGITSTFRRLASTMEKVFNRKLELIDS